MRPTRQLLALVAVTTVFTLAAAPASAHGGGVGVHITPTSVSVHAHGPGPGHVVAKPRPRRGGHYERQLVDVWVPGRYVEIHHPATCKPGHRHDHRHKRCQPARTE